jgi:hypothetical protein
MSSLNQEDRRKHTRLKIAIPVFVRGIDDSGKTFVELATILNLSACGALLMMLHKVASGADLAMELPSAPLVDDGLLREAVRHIQGRITRVIPKGKCYVAGMQFVVNLQG